MPTYEYKCEKCGTVFEKRQRFSDQPLTAHPECGGPVHRLLSAPAFQLKGTGWYATDYAKGNANSSHAASGNGAKSEGSKTESTKNDTGSKTESTTPASTTTATESKSS
jgi:putative FmdB family regulatory protein